MKTMFRKPLSSKQFLFFPPPRGGNLLSYHDPEKKQHKVIFSTIPHNFLPQPHCSLDHI